LFEDNAEFGLGMRLAVDSQRAEALRLVSGMSARLGDVLARGLAEADQTTEEGINAQRERVAALREALRGNGDPGARRLLQLSDYLVRKSVWLLGGDGWAYDIGFGGLDHVLSLGRDVNVLVLDTEVYSNTGGQQSKATPLGAAAKFAAAGKGSRKKDLGMMAMSYGNVYVAQVAFGAKDAQTVRAFVEAEAHPGPSLIIAYSHCIAHGYDLAFGAEQQRLAVESGIWPLYRFDPQRGGRGEPPLRLDSGPPKVKAIQYARNEQRFRMAEKIDPKRFKRLLEQQQRDVMQRFAIYQQLAGIAVSPDQQAPGGSDGAGVAATVAAADDDD